MRLDRLHVHRPGDPAWDTWLEGVGDFYHGAAYHRLAQQAGEGEAHLAVYGEPGRFLAWPYLLSRIDGTDLWDASSVYGYCGPVARGCESDEEFLQRAWRSFREAWEQQGVVSLFTRFHPLLANHELCASFRGDSRPQGEELAGLGCSVSIDLELDRDQRRRIYRKALRREIRLARRAGMEVGVDDGWDHFDTFVDLYSSTMERNEAEQRYRLSRQYLEDLRAALHPNVHLVVARLGAEVAAALVLVVHRKFAHAHLAGVNPRFQDHSPLKVLIDGVADVGQSLGCDVLHLGAGRGGREDSLFQFKRRFSLRLHEFVIGRWVLNREHYEALCGKRDRGPRGMVDTGFFPAYGRAGAASPGA